MTDRGPKPSAEPIKLGLNEFSLDRTREVFTLGDDSGLPVAGFPFVSPRLSVPSLLLAVCIGGC